MLLPNGLIVQCCLTSKGYKGFGPADLRILHDEKILGGGNAEYTV